MYTAYEYNGQLARFFFERPIPLRKYAWEIGYLGHADARAEISVCIVDFSIIRGVEMDRAMKTQPAPALQKYFLLERPELNGGAFQHSPRSKDHPGGVAAPPVDQHRVDGEMQREHAVQIQEIRPDGIELPANRRPPQVFGRAVEQLDLVLTSDPPIDRDIRIGIGRTQVPVGSKDIDLIMSVHAPHEVYAGPDGTACFIPGFEPIDE